MTSVNCNLLGFTVHSDAVEASPLSVSIKHRLSANIKEAGRLDTAEDSFIHAFRSLNNKGDYDEESKSVHVEWIVSTYKNQRIGYILGHRPLMRFLRDLMGYNYFEQDGKVPVTLYHGWSTCSKPDYGVKGGVGLPLCAHLIMLVDHKFR